MRTLRDAVTNTSLTGISPADAPMPLAQQHPPMRFFSVNFGIKQVSVAAGLSTQDPRHTQGRSNIIASKLHPQAKETIPNKFQNITASRDTSATLGKPSSSFTAQRRPIKPFMVACIITGQRFKGKVPVSHPKATSTQQGSIRTCASTM